MVENRWFDSVFTVDSEDEIRAKMYGRFLSRIYGTHHVGAYEVFVNGVCTIYEHTDTISNVSEILTNIQICVNSSRAADLWTKYEQTRTYL